MLPVTMDTISHVTLQLTWKTYPCTMEGVGQHKNREHDNNNGGNLKRKEGVIILEVGVVYCYCEIVCVSQCNLMGVDLNTSLLIGYDWSVFFSVFFLAFGSGNNSIFYN